MLSGFKLILYAYLFQKLALLFGSIYSLYSAYLTSFQVVPLQSIFTVAIISRILARSMHIPYTYFSKSHQKLIKLQHILTFRAL